MPWQISFYGFSTADLHTWFSGFPTGCVIRLNLKKKKTIKTVPPLVHGVVSESIQTPLHFELIIELSVEFLNR